ncbi:MAG: sarcosine oxidase subunit alpha family protein [Acetobacteraceae bacterium]|nr:sarcosine oxidase subunit alpha family protein [Acetobacteraceae bacterium]
MTRLAAGGRIDRTRSLHFRFDGVAMEGFPGDTLASALLANGVRLVGRSFKLHRPRGILSAGHEEPNALVELRAWARREPNTRATVVELFDGLVAESQNRWPCLRYDAMAVNQLFQRFLWAGFYYKTFMWPKAFWERLYEPLIRRAAGLGKGIEFTDPDRYDTRHAHCDVLVVGSGAAGLAAARTAADAGCRVILADHDFELGGGLLREPAHEVWRATQLAALGARPDVTLLARTSVFGAYEHGEFGAVERLGDHLAEPPPHTARQRLWMIRAREAVIATGGHERFVAFPGNDRPGVMLAGSAATYAARFAVRAGERAVLFANHDAAYQDAFLLQDAGVQFAAIVDPRADGAAQAEARARQITVHAGCEVSATEMQRQKRHLSAVRVRGRGRPADAVVPCDLLMVAGGWNPAVHLPSQALAPLSWHEGLCSFVPESLPDGLHVAGLAAGVWGIGECARSGAEAGAAAARAAGHVPSAPDLPVAEEAASPDVLALWEVKAQGKAFVDLQGDVTADDIRLAHREGYDHIEYAKRYTTHAMGTEQGKSGGILGAAVLAEAQGEAVAKVGLPKFRPYAVPVTWGALAGEHVGRHYAPTRRTALHDWHLSRGAVMMETGPWLRPAYYPRPEDADAWASVVREGRAARGKVAVCDVSTLGKIAVSGPDAGKFLDLLYTNSFSNLPVGRARYGLMLREDGIVFDDGTTSRFGAQDFYMTTTTANAAAVMSHMEFHHQTVWPELDVQYASITDQWAGMSICGPRAREVVAAVVDRDLGNLAFPFMAVADCRAAGVPAKLFRISFSGELAYELHVPAGYAVHVWEAVLAAGAAHGIVPYGIEALGLLRIEKGHVAGAELDGNTSAHDLGLARMLKKRGEFIGRTLAGRPALRDPARPRLVGVRPVRRGDRLSGGWHLVSRLDDRDSQGWITSVTQGAEIEGWLGLALVRNGPERVGLHMVATSPLHGAEVPVEICSPHFVDAENARVRA